MHHTRIQTWSLDTLGNWGVNPANGTSIADNSRNQYTTFKSHTLAYDNNGNLTTDQSSATLKYDAWNRLVSATTSSSLLLDGYAYDARGFRIQETASLTTTDVYFTHGWQVIEERQGSATATAQYTWSVEYIDALAFRDDSTGLSRRIYAQQDANWNTTALVDIAGAAQERYIYDPYGNVTVLAPGGPQRGSGAASASIYSWTYLHQGGRLDITTALYTFRNRDYSAALGRWTERDPAEYMDALNLYEFGASSPVDNVDSDGCDVAPKQGDRQQGFLAS